MFRRLRPRLVALMLLVAMVPLLAATLVVRRILLDQAERTVAAQLDGRKRICALAVEELRREVRLGLAGLAADNTVKTTLRYGVYPQLQRYLEQLRREHGLDFLLAADMDGGVVAAAPQTVSPTAPLTTSPLLEKVRGRGEVAGGFLRDSLLAGELHGGLVVAALTPVTVRGAVHGYLYGGRRLDGPPGLAWLRRVQAASSADHLALVGEDLALATWQAPAASPAVQVPDMAAGDQPVTILGRRYDAARLPFADILGRPLGSLVVYSDHERALAGVQRVERVLAVIVVGALVVALALALAFAATLVRPLHRVLEAMTGFAGEAEPVAVPVAGGPEEIRRLARGYNDMAGRIRESLTRLRREVAERRRAEEALFDRQERLAITLDAIGDGVLVLDHRGCLSYLNPAAEAILGVKAGEVVGHPLDRLPLVADTGAPPEVGLGDLLRDGSARTGGEWCVPAAEGGQRHLAWRAAPLRDRRGDDRGTVVVLRDLTAQRRLEEEQIRAQKLESLGLLAGGIAHDFNNLLTAIVGNINLARVSGEHGGRVDEFLERAEKASLQARTLTRRLLVFAKGGEPVRKPLFTDQLIKEAVDLALRGQPVQPRLQLARDLWPVEADEGQLAQVFNNLAINAVQAMSDGGTLTIRADNLVLAAANGHGLAEGPYVRVQVEDTGCGIPPEVKDRIFDPYFTTKKTGSGLGLATVFTIVRKHQGWVGVESQVGQGTVFTVLLPAFGGEMTAVAPAGHQRQATPVSGRVLVMDDEEPVARTLSAMLRHLGYQVEVTAHGDDALESWGRARRDKAPFRFGFLDLTIVGGRGGRETAAAILAMDPQAILVAVSGYADDPILAAPQQYGFRACLPKPFLLADLTRVLAGLEETAPTGPALAGESRPWAIH